MSGLDAYFADEHEIRDEFWRPSAGDVVIDAGSAEGSYTLPALLAGATVYAIEPFQHRLDTLIRLADERGVGDRLVALREALNDGGPIADALMRDLHAAAPVTTDMAPPDGTPWSTIDELVDRFGIDRLDWVKIDVEGAELGVVRGGIASFRKFRPRLLIEDHTSFYPYLQDGANAAAMADILERLGYTISRTPYSGPTSGPRDMWKCEPDLM